MTGDAQLNRQLMSAQVEDEVVRFILRECEVGDKLPNEHALAEKFGTGRSTIREVMKGLEKMGMVTIRHGSGTYVASKSIGENDPLHLTVRRDKFRLALELFDVRLMLEPEIAAKAAEMRTEEEAKEILFLCDEVERIYLSGEDHSQADIHFHSCIAKCTGNSVVQALVPLIQSGVVTFCNVTGRKLMEETISTHRAIAEAILEKDIVGARCAMMNHLAANRSFILKTLKERDAGGEKESL